LITAITLFVPDAFRAALNSGKNKVRPRPSLGSRSRFLRSACSLPKVGWVWGGAQAPEAK